jgi:multidrug efflux pump subunit AcrA (membrane-fusion protein)
MKPTTRFSALAVALAVVSLGVGYGCGQKDRTPGSKPSSESAPAAKYYCPMHPTYTSDKPGDCPICNMRLVPMKEGAAGEHSGHVAGDAERKIVFYRSPMDPSVTSPVPMKDPMGMDYVPVYEDEVSGGAAPSGPQGYIPVRISPEKQQLIGVRLAKAEVGPEARTIRTVGRVEYDETRLHHVHTKVDGWIGTLYVSYTGQSVETGQPLFTLYSPEIVATQQEYLMSLAAAGKSGGAEGSVGDLAASAERRLLLWDIHHPEIEEIERAGQPKTYVDIVSHATGIVVEKKALEGMRAMPGEDLYVIADLARVWVTASIYEYELPLVRVGQAATIDLSYSPGRTFAGRIAYVYPYLDEKTRTARVRIEFDNPELLLKPGMYANVEIGVPLAEGITVPSDAVLDSGDHRIVFVAKGNGYFEPREVRLGARIDGRVAVLEGVAPGEEVVVGAQFLIDSESQLKAALAGMGGAGEHRH